MPMSITAMRLVRKMSEEHDAAQAQLFAKFPGMAIDDILDAVMIQTCEDFIMAIVEGMELNDEQAGALLESDTPCADLYAALLKAETSYMDDIRNVLVTYADKLLKRKQ